MQNEKMAVSLSNVLADTYALMIKTHNFHWNLVGPGFYPLHKLFQEQYEDMFEAVDELAERIRQLGSFAPGSLSAFAKLTKIQDANGQFSIEEMLKILIEDTKTILESIKDSESVAKSENDEGTLDLLVQREQVHSKSLWILESSI